MVNRVDANQRAPPRNVKEMRRHPDAKGYIASLFKELDAFSRTGNLNVPTDMDIHDIPPDMILQLMPLFSKKYEGLNFSKFKCRMVVLGNHWKNVHGVSTFSNMVDMDTLKFIIAIAAVEGWEFFKTDVAEAFLTTTVNKKREKRHADVPDEPDGTYYARRPPGLTDDDMPYIIQPDAYIYGHPRAGREFSLDVKEGIVGRYGYSVSNYCGKVYFHTDELGTAIIAHATDDLPTIASTPAKKKQVLEMISTLYPNHTKEDPATIILGMTVSFDRERKTATLRQEAAIVDLLNSCYPEWESVGLETLPKVPLPPPPAQLGKKDRLLITDMLEGKEITEYQSRVGQLNWITNTVHKIMPAQRLKAKRNANPTAFDMKQVNHIIRHVAYLQRTGDHGMTIGGSNGVSLLATVDTSYAPTDPYSSDLRSITGGTIHMSAETGSIISLCARHDFTTDSSMAAEGVGCHLVVKKVLPLRIFLNELGFSQTKPTMIYMDNEPFLNAVTGDKGASNRSKHIMIKLNIIHEAYQAGEIEFAHMSTNNIPSDGLTKLLAFKDYDHKAGYIDGTKPLCLEGKPRKY